MLSSLAGGNTLLVLILCARMPPCMLRACHLTCYIPAHAGVKGMDGHRGVLYGLGSDGNNELLNSLKD